MSSEERLLLAYALRAAPPSDPAAFRRLVGPPGPLGGITALCLLLYQAGARNKGVWHFLFHRVPHLVPQLHRTFTPEHSVVSGRAHGRIDWATTLKARSRSFNNASIFACRERQASFERLENQLLLALLRSIEACLARVPNDVATWSILLPGGLPGENRPALVGDVLTATRQRLSLYNTRTPLRRVTMPRSVTRDHLRAAGAANPDYGYAAGLYELYRNAVEATQWEHWAHLVNHLPPCIPAAAADAARQIL